MANSRKEIEVTDCPIESALAIIGGRWKARILWELHCGKRRYGELRRSIDGVSEKVLIQQLRQLESDGVITRTDFGGTPPRVEYGLTPLGESLGPVMDAITAWSERRQASRAYVTTEAVPT